MLSSLYGPFRYNEIPERVWLYVFVEYNGRVEGGGRRVDEVEVQEGF